MGPKILIFIVFFSNVNYMNTSIPIVKLWWAHKSLDKKNTKIGWTLESLANAQKSGHDLTKVCSIFQPTFASSFGPGCSSSKVLSFRRLLVRSYIAILVLQLSLWNNKIAQEVKIRCRFTKDPIKCVGRKLLLCSVLSRSSISLGKKLCIANQKQPHTLRKQENC